MPVRKITEQQFRTRRKDRRMVWVDAAALLVGLVVLAGSVTGIVVIEPEPEPIDWSYTFPEGKVTQKWCAGMQGLKEGCQTIDPRNPTIEGEPQALLMAPITAANVTQAVFRLTWTDDEPDVKNKKSDHHGKRYRYDDNSTDTLRLEVTAPWGETFSVEGTNDLELKNGALDIIINLTAPPEPGSMEAFDKATVQRALMAEHTVKEHKALGEWQTVITVVRAGDQNGTLPQGACGDVPPEATGPLPPDVTENCYLDDDQDKAEGYGASAAPNYYATYDDIGNKWVLEFYVRTWSSSVSF